MGGLIAIGIDPGLRTGVAWLEELEFVSPSTGGFRLPDVNFPLRVGGPDVDFGYAEIGNETRDKIWPDVLVIEVPEAYPGSPVRVSDIVDLAFLAGAIAEKADRCVNPARNCRPDVVNARTEIVKVHPRKWKGQMPKPVHHARLFQRLPWLEAEIEKFKKSDREHVVDAVGLALYGIETMKTKGQKK